MGLRDYEYLYRPGLSYPDEPGENRFLHFEYKVRNSSEEYRRVR